MSDPNLIDPNDKIDVTLRTVKVQICQACLDGIGEMCNTPGCFLIRHDVINGWSEYEYEIVSDTTAPGKEVV